LTLVCWVDALEGPVKSHLRPHRDAAAEAAESYATSRTTFDPVGVRLALLDRLLAEEALAARELGPRGGPQDGWAAARGTIGALRACVDGGDGGRRLD
jgi:hypothetical protein